MRSRAFLSALLIGTLVAASPYRVNAAPAPAPADPDEDEDEDEDEDADEEPEPEAEPVPEAEPDAEPVPEAEPDAEPVPEAEPDAEPGPDAEPVSEPEVEPAPTPTPEPEAAPDLDPGPDFSVPPGRGARLTFGIVGGVLALGGLGLAGMSAYSVSRASFYRDRVHTTTDDARADAIAQGQRQNRVAAVTGVSAGVLLGTGIALIVLAARQPARTQISPTFSRRTAGVTLRYRF